METEITNMIIDLRGRGNVPFNATIDVINYFKNILHIMVDKTCDVISTLFAPFDDPDVHNKVVETNLAFNSLKTIFDKFGSEYRIRKLFENHPRFVSPEPIVIGSYHAVEHVLNEGESGVSIVEKPRIAQYVSIKKTFLSLSKDPNYLKNLMKEPEVENGIYSCFQSGSRFRELSANGPQGIVSYIKIFYDGLGLTNPLKAGETKNNSGMFYFTNLSLSPRYNSTLANIHLLAMCHTNDIKNKDALNQLLSKIVSELKDLGKNGIAIETNDGEKMTLYVNLGQFTADNLGMNKIFGLVESFSGDYCCILCYATREDMQTYETEEEFELRCPREYEIYISMLENLPPGQSWGERALFESDERSRSNWKNVSKSASEDLLSGSSMTATPSSGQYLKLIG
ncbi:uncharacterized protein LOC116929552 [Daphnia magna]|uniref:uncharacterized protein LOC116929552 n=1 Tax=Daphnia magna TaxID=35525 RepID=UPI001403434C|nr:uncharacterized protein LOC116929552 [Daphnia magna]